MTILTYPCSQYARVLRGPTLPLQDPSGELYHASMKLTMTSYNSANSSDCITAGTCKPLGGYSVWSAIPPVPLDPRTDRRPIILVLAQIDSIDMFHDNVQVGFGSVLTFCLCWCAICCTGVLPKLGLREYSHSMHHAWMTAR
eukprot:GHUV01039689.1.p1 GENE.GHUV01039689.1~~GHUV01039689.1.p1  ORF type:complete len:142 (-),score=18.50 GHUV01039689.1:418-843(-)